MKNINFVYEIAQNYVVNKEYSTVLMDHILKLLIKHAKKEYMEMNGKLIREKDPDFNISINKNDDRMTDDIDDTERVIIVESSKELAKCLEDEGYRIWHKPYFAMPGYTHSKWTVKPDKKEALDAAKNNLKAITAEEFIKTFG